LAWGVCNPLVLQPVRYTRNAFGINPALRPRLCYRLSPRIFPARLAFPLLLRRRVPRIASAKSCARHAVFVQTIPRPTCRGCIPLFCNVGRTDFQRLSQKFTSRAYFESSLKILGCQKCDRLCKFAKRSDTKNSIHGRITLAEVRSIYPNEPPSGRAAPLFHARPARPKNGSFQTHGLSVKKLANLCVTKKTTAFVRMNIEKQFPSVDYPLFLGTVCLCRATARPATLGSLRGAKNDAGCKCSQSAHAWLSKLRYLRGSYQLLDSFTSKAGGLLADDSPGPVTGW